jgi:hypothetical protein
MPKKNRRVQVQKRWQPLAPAAPIPFTQERADAMRAEALARGADPRSVDRLMNEPREMRKNDRYTVTITRRADRSIEVLSIRRNDRGADFPWRDLQRMKSELAGDEVEAVELFPAESRLMDTANQRWLWCLPPGQKFPFGYRAPRNVSGPEEAARVGARQAALT